MDDTSTAGTQGLIGALRRVLESAGGFTLHHRTGEHARHGLSVCANPAATLTFPLGAWDDEQVDTWFHTWAARLTGSDLHLGGWLDPATQCVSLDVVRVYPADRRHDAVRLAQKHQQHAVFDLGQGEVLVTGARPVVSAG
jgi:hypothetical protein